MASIETNHINIVLVISVAIHIFDKTTISVKNNIIIFAQLAIIFAVFCFVRSSAWKTTPYTKFANLTQKNHIIIAINRLGK